LDKIWYADTESHVDYDLQVKMDTSEMLSKFCTQIVFDVVECETSLNWNRK